MESPALHPFFAVDAPVLLISHGGDTASGATPGTSTAFRRAHELGFRAFQVDVVAAADGALLSMHAVFGRKPHLERGDLEGVRSRLADVPTLAELFDRYPDVRWNIEMKSTRCEAPLVELIEQHPARHLLCVSAPFHTRVLRRLRRRFPDLATNASLLEGALFGVRLMPWRSTAGTGVQLIQRFAFGRIVRWNLDRGRVVHAWTVNDAERARELSARGITGLIVDDFDAVSSAVASSRW